jgi:alpha-L-fucosidase
MTMNTTWGYSKHDLAWKSDETLIRNLIDIVSKGGNYLLNIGPRGDGSIPEASLRSMAAIGRWMDVNSESICGSNASPFDKPAWGRYTRKAGKLYAHVFQWPEDGTLNITESGIHASRAYLLADKKQDLRIEQTPNGLRIHVPENAPDIIASVVAIEYETRDPPNRMLKVTR